MISVWIKSDVYSVVAPRIDARKCLHMATFYIIPVVVIGNAVVTSAVTSTVVPIAEIIPCHNTGYQKQAVQKGSLEMQTQSNYKQDNNPRTQIHWYITHGLKNLLCSCSALVNVWFL